MASAAAWRSIQTHGLLTTEQLVDMYQVSEAIRASILNRKRETVVIIERQGMPDVVIRDQKPMKFIEDKIDPGSSLRLYLNAINARVFFWPTRDRLTRLLGAREYRGKPQVILHVDTAKLVERHTARVELCRFNSGAVTQKNHPPRGHLSWIPVSEYPYDDFRRRYGRAQALAEVTVRDGVPDVLELVSDVERVEA